MKVRVRKERFGYVLFRHEDRKYHFFNTNSTCDDILPIINQYFLEIKDTKDVDFIENTIDNDLELNAPIGMYLEISSHCNLNCSHCYKPHDISHNQMTLPQYINLIDELAAMGVFEIRLCGNEPTTSKYFFDVARHIKEKNLYLGINTNGFFDTKLMKYIGELNPDLVVVSVDGTRETHTRIRGKGVYDKAITFLEYLKDIGIKRRINTVISKQTIKTIPYIAKLANDLECGVSFLPFRPVGKNSNYNHENAINQNDMRRVVEEIMQQRINFPRITLLTYFDVLAEVSTYHHPIDRFNDPCPARKNGFITYSGDYFPCDFLRYAGKQFYCGNIIKKGFRYLWSSSESLKLFQNTKHIKCNKCKYYMKSCYGGCISGSLASTNNPDDELCFVSVDTEAGIYS